MYDSVLSDIFSSLNMQSVSYNPVRSGNLLRINSTVTYPDTSIMAEMGMAKVESELTFELYTGALPAAGWPSAQCDLNSLFGENMLEKKSSYISENTFLSKINAFLPLSLPGTAKK